MYRPFTTENSSHEHSLETLQLLYEFDDFMESVGTVVDMGCGPEGLDLEWWATRTLRDENNPEPLNIKCTGVDLVSTTRSARDHKNIVYLQRDFEDFEDDMLFDVVWCHDAFQYALNPLKTLADWWHKMTPSGMLVLALPQSTNVEFNELAFDQWSGCYHNHTVVSLIHQLAINGFDCCDGFFKKAVNDPWLHAIVYKSEHEPMNPRDTNWYQLDELGLIPATASQSLKRFGHVRQRDLVLPWLDKSLTWFAQH
jgi:SAM-dependent methyltransferase